MNIRSIKASDHLGLQIVIPPLEVQDGIVASAQHLIDQTGRLVSRAHARAVLRRSLLAAAFDGWL